MKLELQTLGSAGQSLGFAHHLSELGEFGVDQPGPFSSSNHVAFGNELVAVAPEVELLISSVVNDTVLDLLPIAPMEKGPHQLARLGAMSEEKQGMPVLVLQV